MGQTESCKPLLVEQGHSLGSLEGCQRPQACNPVPNKVDTVRVDLSSLLDEAARVQQLRCRQEAACECPQIAQAEHAAAYSSDSTLEVSTVAAEELLGFARRRPQREADAARLREEKAKWEEEKRKVVLRLERRDRLEADKRARAEQAAKFELEAAEAARVAKERRQAVDAFLSQNGFKDISSRRRRLMKITYALHVAIKKDDLRMAFFLMQEGADPTQKDSAGLTAAQLLQRRYSSRTWSATDDDPVTRLLAALSASNCSVETCASSAKEVLLPEEDASTASGPSSL